MSRKWTRWGLLFGLFLCAAMHATSAMADSGWCISPYGYAYSYQGMLATCQATGTAAVSNGWTITDPCHVVNQSPWDGNGYTGTWAASYVYSDGFPSGSGADWFCGGFTPPSPGKANGEPTCHTCVGDPINAGNGNVYRREEDFHAGQWLSFARFYNSDPSAGLDTFGQHWRHAYSSHITYVVGTTAGTGTATVTREDGRVSTYTITNGMAAGEPDVFDALTEQTDSNGNPSGWSLARVDTRSTERFDANGRLIAIQGQDGFITTLIYSTATTPTTVAPGASYLIAITDPSQRSIQLTYTASGLINHVTAPDGSGYTYAYSGANLISVTYPDGKLETYLYNESPNNGGATAPALLTGILDESKVRFQSYSYNASGQATNDQRAGGIASYTVTYNSDGSADVFDSLGTSRHHGMTTILGVPYVTSVNGTCESCSPTTGWVYDFNGQLNQSTDFDGNVTTYQHDGEGLLTGTVEGSGSSTPRPVLTDWNDTLHVPVERRWLGYNNNIITKTDWVYNSRGQALAECRIDMRVSAAASYACVATGTPPAGVRRSTYTYCDAVASGCPLIGLLLTSTGPRTDLMQTTTYSYYSNGDLQSVTV
jgi:YD repeat-containing protein